MNGLKGRGSSFFFCYFVTVSEFFRLILYIFKIYLMTQRHGLFRSRTDKVFGGVAGGIAKSLNTDPSIVRLIFALLVVFGGGGLLIYLIMWIAIPEEPLEFYQNIEGTDSTANEHVTEQENTPYGMDIPKRKGNQGALIGGLIMIAIGLIFLADRFLPRIHLGDLWPLVIVIAGLALIFSSFTGTKKA